MLSSTCDSFRDNELTCAIFSTPYGIPFFGWTGDGYRKLTMEELRSQYENWEGHQAGAYPLTYACSLTDATLAVALKKQAQTLAHEADEARVEEELFKENEDEGQSLNHLTVEDYGTFARLLPEQRNLTPITILQFPRSSTRSL